MNLTTPSHKIYPLRATGPEDTLLDLTTAGDFAQKPATAVDLLQDSLDWTDNSSGTPAVTNILKANGIEKPISLKRTVSK
jgi:hypothetical protein